MNVGDKIGCLLVLETGLKKVHPSVTLNAVRVQCTCGNILIKSLQEIRVNRNHICTQGCPNVKNTPLDLSIKESDFLVKIGEVYGNLEVLDNPYYRLSKRNSKGKDIRYREQIVKCKCLLCDTEKIVNCQNLIYGKSKSCGPCSHNSEELKNVNLIGKKRCEKCNTFKDKKFFGYRKESVDKLNHMCRKCAKYTYIEKKIIPSYEFDKMNKEQGGKCKICKATRPDKRTEKLFVDHCHKTGKVRGLLCSSCNVALGNFKDNIKLLKKAISYLENNS